ncbi:hypothetical protein ILUMI_00031 [Ignelater luminosus]|uniref:Uncharacterized protein n=1 Tax=Ignelater luminosus TaxID=2038154 RepID=A0A8K0DLA3_IGNLU|nr:hypothetical protein ILUMI_00031 [Ignelater luminosus]
MAPTAAEKAEKVGSKTPKVSKKKFGKSRNYDLGNGVCQKVASTKKPVKPLTVGKSIGGKKNGGTLRNYYATQDKIKKYPAIST